RRNSSCSPAAPGGWLRGMLASLKSRIADGNGVSTSVLLHVSAVLAPRTICGDECVLRCFDGCFKCLLTDCGGKTAAEIDMAFNCIVCGNQHAFMFCAYTGQSPLIPEQRLENHE